MDNQTASRNEQKSTSSDGGSLRLRPVGMIPGPTIRGQKTFCIVLGLFDFMDNQAVHTYADGTERPITILSHPLPEDNSKKGILL